MRQKIISISLGKKDDILARVIEILSREAGIKESDLLKETIKTICEIRGLYKEGKWDTKKIEYLENKYPTKKLNLIQIVVED